MKKRSILTSAVLMTVSALFAQKSVLNATQADSCSLKSSKYEVLTNPFCYNWFASVGAGGPILVTMTSKWTLKTV